MYNFALGTLLACFAFVTQVKAEEIKGPDANCLDGVWSVVCYEKGGEQQADAKGMAVKAEAGTITCAGKDGKAAMTMKVKFGPNGTIQVTEVNADTSAAATPAKVGVYVLTAEFLAISLNTEAGANPKTSVAESNKSRCNLILKRESAK